MDQEKYYEISTIKNLPLRCPILNYCTRRAYTIYFFSEYGKYNKGADVVTVLQNNGVLPKDFIEKQIPLQGESPIWMRGSDNFYFSNMCPEVNLFDGENALFPKISCVEADYDSYRSREKHRTIKCQHFCECPEFNKFSFEEKTKPKKDTKRRRPAIPYKIKSLLQKEINSKCPNCPSRDVDHFQIHHIDENPENNNYENLLMLCPTCHSKITKKDITPEKVVEIKNSLTK